MHRMYMKWQIALSRRKQSKQTIPTQKHCFPRVLLAFVISVQIVNHPHTTRNGGKV